MSSNKNDQNSSKTAHVMNLLSRGGRGAAARQAQTQPVPASVSAPAPAPDPAQEAASESTSFSATAEVPTQTTSAPPTTAPVVQAPPAPQVPPIISIMNADAEASATIKDALEGALENALLQDPTLLDPFEQPSTATVHTAPAEEEIGFAPMVDTEPVIEPAPPAAQTTPTSVTPAIPISTSESEAEPPVLSSAASIPTSIEEPAPSVESAVGSVVEDAASSTASQTTPNAITEPEILPAVPEAATPSQVQLSTPSTPTPEFTEPEISTITEDPVSEEAGPVVSMDDLPTEPTVAAESAALDDDAIDFTSVNVMESVVESKVDKYIDLFGLCHCPRCRADVIALALNRLPAKYIVMPKNEALPRISMYESSLGTVATAEILWACKAVFDAPRHKKES